MLCVVRRAPLESLAPLGLGESVCLAGDELWRRDDEVLFDRPLSENGVGEPCLELPPTGNTFAPLDPRGRDGHDPDGVVVEVVVDLMVLNCDELGIEVLSESESHVDETEYLTRVVSVRSVVVVWLKVRRCPLIELGGWFQLPRAGEVDE